MNRYATNEDVALFEPYLNPNALVITPGMDYIFDTFTKADAQKRIWITQAETQLSKLINGSTVWFLASALEDFEAIIISNESGPSGDVWPHVQEVNFRIIPDAQLKMKRGPLSYANNPFKIHGLKNPKIHFKSVQFPIWDINTPFQRDAIPFHVDSDTFFTENGHGFWLLVPDGGKAEVDGVSGGGGSFTMNRFQADKAHGYSGINFTDSYAHDTESETNYHGATSGTPYLALKDYKADRILSVRAGTDGWQGSQHLQGSEIGQIYIHNAAFKWPKAFQRWQDAGAQIVVDCGVNHIKTIFIDGFGSNGLSLMGSPPYTAPNGQPSFVKATGDGLIIDKAYIYGGHLGIYMNQSASQGMIWRIKELWVGGMTDEYASVTGISKADYYLEHAGTDKVIIEKLYHDGSRPRLAKDNTKFQVNEVILLQDFPRPIYKYPHYQFTNWSEFVADYHPCANGTRMKYKAGKYYTDRENGFPAVFCRCKKDHISTSTRLKFDSENFEIITWDEKGVPSDKAGWSATDKQRPYPGDNFTHEHDSPLKDFFWMTTKPKIETGTDYFIQDNTIYYITREGKNYKGGTVTPV